MAGVLEHHLTSLQAGSDPERSAYTTLVNDYRALAATLDAIADRMASYRDLPQAEHNAAALTSHEAVQKFVAFVESERALRELLEGWVGRDEGMLEEMRRG